MVKKLETTGTLLELHEEVFPKLLEEAVQEVNERLMASPKYSIFTRSPVNPAARRPEAAATPNRFRSKPRDPGLVDNLPRVITSVSSFSR